jgi:hypothetical protein
MTDAEILIRARELVEKNGRALWFVVGWKTATVLACVIGFVVSMLARYVQFTGTAPMVDLVPDIVLSVAVPLLFIGPVMWLIYRRMGNPYEKA